MKAIHSGLLATLIIMGIGCNPLKNKDPKEEAFQNIQATIDHISACYDSIQYSELYKLSDEVYNQYEWFKTNYKDTSKPSFWIKDLSDLQRVERSIRKSRGDSSTLANELNFSKSQLLALSNSYLKGELDSVSFHTYLIDEENALQELRNRIRLRHLETEEGLEKWTRLKPILDSTRRFTTDL
jgi:hypothetical protein